MPAPTLTRNGQTTIPKAIREYLRHGSGDRMKCSVEDNGGVVLVLAIVDVREWEGMLPPPKKPVARVRSWARQWRGSASLMSRPCRIECPGAIYHVIPPGLEQVHGLEDLILSMKEDEGVYP